MIPTRTLKGDVLWPETLAGSVYVADAMPPAGVEHHYCPLAIVDADLTGILTLVSDCRPLFPPLTKLTHFFYLSGDGQEALPGDPLPQPLEVGVANGGLPRAAARVRFQIFGTAGTATLTGEDGSSGTQITVTTDTSGIACCAWTLDTDPAHRSQVVTAVLLNDSGSAVNLPPIQFNATANIALYYVGGDGQPVMPGRPAPQPLQVRVSHGDFRAVGRLVRFEDESGTGSLAADLAGLGAGAASFDATVNADGVAECAWQPSWPADPNVVSQRTRARLLDPVGNPVLPPIHFTAHLDRGTAGGLHPGLP